MALEGKLYTFSASDFLSEFAAEYPSVTLSSNKGCSSKYIPRLYGRHFANHIPPILKKKLPARHRRVCCSTKENEKKIRKETKTYCLTCNIGLGIDPYFHIYHTKVTY